jgi:hypothetical protein
MYINCINNAFGYIYSKRILIILEDIEMAKGYELMANGCQVKS